MTFLPSLDTLLKGILLPASIALAIYLSATYIIYPLYVSRRRYAQYLPLSPSSGFLGQTFHAANTVLEPVRSIPAFGFLARVRDVLFNGIARRIGFSIRRRGRVGSFDEFFGDEELEDGDGNGVLSNDDGRAGGGGRRDIVTGQEVAAGSERRLSRELEAGFRDDSDDDEEEGGRRQRR